ncbi:hypothetical protein H0H81_008774, partial [Sphagnurus paluster]
SDPTVNAREPSNDYLNLPGNFDNAGSGTDEGSGGEGRENSDDEEHLPPPVPRSHRPIGQPIDNQFTPRTEELKLALQFKKALEAASLDNGDLDAEQLFNLRNPAEHPPLIDDDNLLLSLKLFISTSNASNQVYTDVRADIMDTFPEADILSHTAAHYLIWKHVHSAKSHGITQCT